MSVKTLKSPNPSLKALALRYASRGWSVVPMHTVKNGLCTCIKGINCTRAGKHPRTANGVNDATTDANQIKKWWEKWPLANIGIATGEESGIIVLEVDPRHGGDKTLNNLTTELGPLLETVSENTGGGGQHLFFKHPAFAVRNDSQGKIVGPGVDILSKGKIAIVTPSRHVSGKHYSWQEGKSIFDRAIADLPKRWLKRVRKGGRTSTKVGEDSALVIGGGRNTYLTSFGGLMQRSGAADDFSGANERKPTQMFASLRQVGGRKNRREYQPLPFSAIRRRHRPRRGHDAARFGSAFLRRQTFVTRPGRPFLALRRATLAASI